MFESKASIIYQCLYGLRNDAYIVIRLYLYGPGVAINTVVIGEGVCWVQANIGAFRRILTINVDSIRAKQSNGLLDVLSIKMHATLYTSVESGLSKYLLEVHNNQQMVQHPRLFTSSLFFMVHQLLYSKPGSLKQENILDSRAVIFIQRTVSALGSL